MEIAKPLDAFRERSASRSNIHNTCVIINHIIYYVLYTIDIDNIDIQLTHIY